VRCSQYSNLKMLGPWNGIGLSAERIVCFSASLKSASANSSSVGGDFTASTTSGRIFVASSGG